MQIVFFLQNQLFSNRKAVTSVQLILIDFPISETQSSSENSKALFNP